MQDHRQQPDKLEQLAQRCRAQGLPLTTQRRMIFEAVLQRSDHPTADQIYHDIQPQMPNVSRTTVYRVLETLVQLEMIRRANHTGAAARFDPNIGHHHHVICQVCQTLRDIDASAIDGLTLPSRFPLGFTMTDYSIYFSGVCVDCQPRADETDDVR